MSDSRLYVYIYAGYEPFNFIGKKDVSVNSELRTSPESAEGKLPDSSLLSHFVPIGDIC